MYIFVAKVPFYFIKPKKMNKKRRPPLIFDFSKDVPQTINSPSILTMHGGTKNAEQLAQSLLNTISQSLSVYKHLQDK